MATLTLSAKDPATVAADALVARRGRRTDRSRLLGADAAARPGALAR